MTAGTEQRQLTVVVGTPAPGQVPPVVAAPVEVSLRPSGTGGTLFVDVNDSVEFSIPLLSAPADTDTPVQASSANPAVADIVSPPGCMGLAGTRNALCDIRAAGSNGETLLTLSVGTAVRSLLVVVGIPGTERVPLTLAPPVEVCVGMVVEGQCVP